MTPRFATPNLLTVIPNLPPKVNGIQVPENYEWLRRESANFSQYSIQAELTMRVQNGLSNMHIEFSFYIEFFAMLLENQSEPRVSDLLNPYGRISFPCPNSAPQTCPFESQRPILAG